MKRALVLLALAAAAAGACRRGAEAPEEGSPRGPAFGEAAGRLPDGEAPAEPTPVGAILADSAPWEDMIGSGYRWRVAVRSAAGVDTIDGLWTNREPSVAGDTLVYGFVVEADGSIPAVFAYDVRTRAAERLPLPEDFLYFTAAALSPDARHLAYAGRAEDGVRLATIVRRWPDGRLVHRSHPVPGYPSDDANSEVVWDGPERVTVMIRLDEIETQGGTWLRVRGAPTGTMEADTVRRTP